MRTVISRKDGTVLWQSEEFDPAFSRMVVPPVDHPALTGESEYVVTNAPTVEEAVAIVRAPENTRGDVGLTVLSESVDADLEPDPVPLPPVDVKA